MTLFSNLSTLFSKAGDSKKAGKKPSKKPSKISGQKSGGASGRKAHQSQKDQSQKDQSQKKRPKQQQDQIKQTAQTQTQPQAQPPQVDQPSQIELSIKQKQQLENKIDTMLREAKARAREIIVEAKDKALEVKAKAEKASRDAELEISKRQRDLDSKLDRLDRKLDQIDQKEKRVEEQRQSLETTKKNLKQTEKKMLERLEEISGMTESEAKQVLLDGLDKKLTTEMAQMVRQKTEEAQQEADDKTQEILIDAMRHGATDFVAEYTVSVVKLPSEDVKGKIIGKSGRNIHAFERKTGVDLDLDFSDTEVRLSCFDPVRREIARIALERLIKDGRIQPARIEKTVDKVKSEVEKLMFEAGKDLCQRVGVYNLPNDLIKFLGRFKYRFSYGQSMIKHTLEETKIGIKVAQELDLDVNIVRLGCLLHDIGKVAETPDGNHVEQGVKIAKRFNMPQEVIDCIAQHHEDEPFTGPEQMAVYIADAISGARPGARYENLEEYIERLGNLEQIATSYSEVQEAYAVQAGREIRILLDPEKSKEDDVTVLATKIKDKIEDKMTYPGTVTVNVIRETRGQAVAK
ncbi:MAG: ribonuclease Y [Candidatus Pacebacteria bacterium]|nr:ribonuclease Y [Candidatus Paceibacterota bacterium]